MSERGPRGTRMHQFSNYYRMIEKLRQLSRLPSDIWQALISVLPGPVGYALRSRFWRNRLKYMGEGVRIDCGAYFQNPQFISIDDNVWIDRSVIILAGQDKSTRHRRIMENAEFPLEEGEVHIGKNVHIAAQCIISGIGGAYISDNCSLASSVKLYSFSNHYRSDEFPSDRKIKFAILVDQDQQYMIQGPVFLDENVGVAVNSVILPGVSIRENSFVLINSVVSTSFEANSLIAGNPARRIRSRFED